MEKFMEEPVNLYTYEESFYIIVEIAVVGI